MRKIIHLIGFILLSFLAACGGSTPSAPTQPNPLAGVPTPSLAPEPTETPIVPPTRPLPTATLSPTQEPETATATVIIPPTEMPTEAATATATSTGLNTSVPQTTDLTIPSAEELPIAATLYNINDSTPRPGIILLHMFNGNRTVWANNGLADALVANGYVVLALDMRGHGETGGGRDWQLAREDLGLVWQWFAERDDVDGARTAVIGGSIGANMALLLGVDEAAIKTAVLLSPGLDYFNVQTGAEIAAYDERPLLIVASEDDGYAATSSQTLFESAGSNARLEMYTDAGHGTNMLTAVPELTELILQWLAENV